MRQCLGSHPFFGTVAWCLFKTLLLPSYATRCRYDVPGMLASGSGLAASACSCACGRCLRIALGSGAGFPFVSLPCRRVVLMGQHLVFVYSPLGGCVSFTPFRLGSVASALSLSESWLFFLLWICQCSCRIQWRRSLEETFEVPMWVGSSSSLHGLSSV